MSRSAASLGSHAGAAHRSPVARFTARRGIGRTLLMSFLGLALIPIILVAGSGAIISFQMAQHDAFARLATVANLRQKAIEDWVGERQYDLQLLVSEPATAENLRTLLRESDNAEAASTLTDRLVATTLASNLYARLFILDSSGNSVVSTDKDLLGTNHQNQPYLQPLSDEAPYISTLFVQSLNTYQIVVAIPVFDRGGYVIGVLVAESNLDQLSPIVLAGARTAATDDSYLVSADSRRYLTPTRFYHQSDTLDTASANEVLNHLDQGGEQSIYDNYNGISVIGVYRLIPKLNIVMLTEQYTSEALSGAQQQLFIALAIALLTGVVAAASAYGITRQIGGPIVSLTATATQIASGDLSQTAIVMRDDEVGTLAQTFNIMTGQLRNSIEVLEERVAERTKQLRASADVGRATVSVLNPDELLRTSINLIADRFGFYYAAIFTLDADAKYAVLREATGEAGRVLKERGHKLEVGGQSMVGYVTHHRKARIALDVGEEAVRFANPLLPETRSEIALPLIVGPRVLGALDVQSTRAMAFDDNSAAVLQAMADQVAIALNNAILFAEAQAVARRSHALYEASQQVSRLEADASSIIDAMMHTVSDTLGFDAWWGLLLDERRTLLTTLAMKAAEQQWPKTVPVLGFENNPIVRSAIHGETLAINDPVNDPYLKNAPPEQRILLKTICAPIVMRGESVGTIVFGRVLDAPDMAQGDLEVAQSLASLTAIAIENSRLLSQTQHALSELDEINRRLTGETWATFTRRRSSDGVVWISNRDRRQRETPPEVEEAFTTGQVATHPIDGTGTLGVAIPINLRDATVGALQLVVPQMLWDHETVVTLESIAGHIAQAAENARLIEQTQRTAQREKAIAGAADKIHRSTDLDTVLRAAVAEINRVTGLGGVSIQLGFGQSEPTDGNGHRTDADGGR